MKKSRRILLIYNPHACSGKSIVHLPDILEYFKQNNVHVDVHETNRPGEASVIAARARTKYGLIVAAGGDGTINEVINGLVADKNQNPVLGIIPLGTENVLAQELGIPISPTEACGRILNGTTRNLDLGLALCNGKKRYFSITAGIGFDAHVASSINPELKKLLGSAAYVLTGLKEFFRYTPTHLRVKMNGVECTGYFVIVGNAKLYGGKAMLAHKADMTDGRLDACILQSKDVFNFVKFLFGVVIHKHDYFEDVVYAQTKKLRIESEKPVLVHVDCEILGMTPVEIEVRPKKLKMVC